MFSHTQTIENEIRDLSNNSPHIFILGAGASLAAFPDGDRNGLKLPLMNNLIEILGIESLLEENNIEHEGRDFEEIYSKLYIRKRFTYLIERLENEIYLYFSRMILPDHPTIYDHLLLSLRKKDLVVTFNWDPFLWQSWLRLFQKGINLPHIAFLHGNVSIGYCEGDRKKGPIDGYCRICGKKFTQTKLLYPIENKQYNDDPYISLEWKSFRNALRVAYMLTIFGYSAPTSDVEAIQIMKEAWGNKYERNLEQIEIIDIKEEDELVRTWEPFIHTHHYQISKDFYVSWVANHPRRSCEAMWNRTMEIMFLDNNKIPKELNFDELLEWYKPLIDEENKE